MPTYDYICRDCSHEFEEFQKMTDPVLQDCPQCNGPLQRKIGVGAGILFKGSGFYVTDYKNSTGSKDESTKTTKTEKTENKMKPKKIDKS